MFDQPCYIIWPKLWINYTCFLLTSETCMTFLKNFISLYPFHPLLQLHTALSYKKMWFYNDCEWVMSFKLSVWHNVLYNMHHCYLTFLILQTKSIFANGFILFYFEHCFSFLPCARYVYHFLSSHICRTALCYRLWYFRID